MITHTDSLSATSKNCFHVRIRFSISFVYNFLCALCHGTKKVLILIIVISGFACIYKCNVFSYYIQIFIIGNAISSSVRNAAKYVLASKLASSLVYHGLIKALLSLAFVSIYDTTTFSGNLLDKRTDHLPNFIIIKNFSLKPRIKKITIRDMKIFNKEKNIQNFKDLDNVNFHL